MKICEALIAPSSWLAIIFSNAVFLLSKTRTWFQRRDMGCLQIDHLLKYGEQSILDTRPVAFQDSQSTRYGFHGTDAAGKWLFPQNRIRVAHAPTFSRNVMR
ncbi:hypothetical protein Mapa_006520 [Marchantia paleacea]|nr:hypothetical protein Mapa_006520 [Marchantia paleacea]